MLAAFGLLVLCYLFGAIPFGYVIARSKGVDLFAVGSGNIGATNVGRALGRKFGLAAFALDFLKGAVPVAAIVPLARFLDCEAAEDWLRVGAGLVAFLGHLFPVYLGFRGGKGVATGAGVMAVLVPLPFAASLLVWIGIVLATRYVSLASLAGAAAIVAARLIESKSAFDIVTLFVAFSGVLVIVKHRANIRRLNAGTESALADGDTRLTLLRGLHIAAIGTWFGSSLFFNFIAAPAMNDAFKEAVSTQPSDRTAGQRIQPAEASDAEKSALASALFGTAVGPLFPRQQMLSAFCAVVVLLTAWGFARQVSSRSSSWRLALSIVAFVILAIGWPLGDIVSHLRLSRFSPDAELAARAKAAFGPWHLVSLGLAAVQVFVLGAILLLAAKLPAGPAVQSKS